MIGLRGEVQPFGVPVQKHVDVFEYAFGESLSYDALVLGAGYVVYSAAFAAVCILVPLELGTQ